ncbi:MAG: peptidoglycan editing factor PgeF [Oscillospiraceae bacterium]|nr:peptidoglycan editing factor PgeF [Oscillospiraceae bacterium]
MSFHELKQGSLLLYTSDVISRPHGFTTRLGGVSSGYLSSMNLGINRGDEPSNVKENYAILGRTLGFDPHEVVRSVQVHRDDIRVVDEKDWGKLFEKTDYEADGLITNTPGTALIVFSADCGTVLLEDPVTGAVGACHAGWRGTAMGIAEKTARELCRVFGAKPENIRAALGPCVCMDCFETDGDVPEAMRKALGDAAENAIRQTGEKYHVDLKTINRTFLLRAGLLQEHIEVSPLCTACDTDTFWSHRRMGDQRGSLGAVIVAGGKA